MPRASEAAQRRLDLVELLRAGSRPDRKPPVHQRKRLEPAIIGVPRVGERLLRQRPAPPLRQPPGHLELTCDQERLGDAGRLPGLA